MIGVKLTILMIVITLIMKYFVRAMLLTKDETDLYLMVKGEKTAWYTVLLGFMVIFDGIGIIYSIIYWLFLR